MRAARGVDSPSLHVSLTLCRSPQNLAKICEVLTRWWPGVDFPPCPVGGWLVRGGAFKIGKASKGGAGEGQGQYQLCILKNKY